jgi:hypothetical protein
MHRLMDRLLLRRALGRLALRACAVPLLFAEGCLLASSCAGEAGSNPRPVAAAPAPQELESARLIGKWLRPDGSYVLEIRGASEDGKLDAGYSNPNPIHVAAATWERSQELGLIVFVELRDTGYPGATYRLQYRAEHDVLVGAYTQPSVGQTFEVHFVRQP